MKCQFCGQNEAEHSFHILVMGEEHEVHLCDECTQKLRQYREAMQGAYAGGGQGFAGPGHSRPRDVGTSPFPAEVDDKIKFRRRLNGLKARLGEAVAAEHYEEAARLRDEIATQEKEVYACE